MPPNDAPHLQLIHSAPDVAAHRASAYNSLTLPTTPALKSFLRHSAALGLDPTDALRLAIERELVLADADSLGVDRHAARHMLCDMAARARVRRGLNTDEAAYIRSLSTGRAVHAPRLAGSLTVTLPQTLLSRAHGTVSTTALEHAAAPELVAWELAARLEGRTMGEWALLAFAGQSRTVSL
jgi:hypothetical protein